MRSFLALCNLELKERVNRNDIDGATMIKMINSGFVAAAESVNHPELGI